MHEASNVKDVSSARASVDLLIHQLNDKYPGSVLTAHRMLTRTRERGDETLSLSKANSKPPARSGNYREASTRGTADRLGG
jgi:hypothetical protein